MSCNYYVLITKIIIMNAYVFIIQVRRILMSWIWSASFPASGNIALKICPNTTKNSKSSSPMTKQSLSLQEKMNLNFDTNNLLWIQIYNMSYHWCLLFFLMRSRMILYVRLHNWVNVSDFFLYIFFSIVANVRCAMPSEHLLARFIQSVRFQNVQLEGKNVSSFVLDTQNLAQALLVKC